MSATNATFQTTIAARDQLTSTVRNMRRELTGLRVDMRGVNTESGNLSTASGLAGRVLGILATRARSYADGMRRMAVGMVSVTAAAAGLTGLGTAGAMFALARGTMSAVSSLDELHQRLGGNRAGTFEQLHRLAFIAGRAGMEVSDLADPLKHLRDLLTGLREGGEPEARSLIRRLGISLRDAAGTDLNAAQIIDQIAYNMEANSDPEVRRRIMRIFFGDEASDNVRLDRMMRNFRNEADRYQRTSAADGLNDLARRSRALREAWDELKAQADSLRYSLGGALAPAFTAVVRAISVLVERNRELLASRRDQWARQWAGYIESIDMRRLLRQLELLAASLRAAAEVALAAIGGIGAALTLLGATWTRMSEGAEAVIAGIEARLSPLRAAINAVREGLERIGVLQRQLEAPEPPGSVQPDAGTDSPPQAAPRPGSRFEEFLRSLARRRRQTSADGTLPGGASGSEAPMRRDRVDVNITFGNLPDHARIRMRQEGPGISEARLNVGHHFGRAFA